jgi:hypothetical protein
MKINILVSHIDNPSDLADQAENGYLNGSLFRRIKKESGYLNRNGRIK